jgi:serine/threonine-protein phosphatase 4 regulatory subunit 1
LDFLASSLISIGYNGIRDHILTLLTDFFQPDHLDEALKQELQPHILKCLVKASYLLTAEDRTDRVLPIILESIRDDADEERRILGLEMVDMLAESLGKDTCTNYLMYEIVSLQDDSVYRVRKETVNRMINISKTVGKDIFVRILFPVYKKLCNDQVWGVRRSTVEMLH